MYSSSLQQHHPDQYRNFFGANDMVLSSSFSTSLIPVGIKNRSHLVMPWLKLPLRCFVGINATTTNNISFGKVKVFHPETNRFQTRDIGTINKHHPAISAFLEHYLKAKGKHTGYTINILAEIDRGRGAGFTGTMASALCTWLLIANHEIDPHLLSEWTANLSPTEVDRIYRLAWHIELLSKHGNSNGYNSFCSLISGKEPIVHYCDAFAPEVWAQGAETLSYYGAKLSDHFPDTIQRNDYPFDRYLVYSGLPSHTDLVEQTKKSDKHKIQAYQNFAKQFFRDGSSDTFFHPYLEDNTFYQIPYHVESFLSIKFLDLLQKIYTHGYTQDLFDNHLKLCKQYIYTSKIIETHHPFLEQWVQTFAQHKQHPLSNMTIVPEYSAKFGWAYLVTTMHWQEQQSIHTTVQMMQKYYPDCHIQASGQVSAPDSDLQSVCLHQYFGKNIFSKYITNHQYRYFHADGTIHYGDYQTLWEKASGDLLLDMVHHKVYYRGKKITSTQLPSQTAVVEVVGYLLQHPQTTVYNTQLPHSSYTKARNQMDGKVLSPFKKLTDKCFGQALPITCKGSLTSFTLYLDEHTLPISLIYPLV